VRQQGLTGLSRQGLRVRLPFAPHSSPTSLASRNHTLAYIGQPRLPAPWRIETPSISTASPSANETGVELLWNRLARRQLSSHSNNTSRALLRHYFNCRRDLTCNILVYYPDSLAVRLNSDLRAQTIQREARRANLSPTFFRARQLFSAVRKPLSNGPKSPTTINSTFSKISSHFVDGFFGIVVRHKLNSEPPEALLRWVR
jgi:hypothetical protein